MSSHYVIDEFLVAGVFRQLVTFFSHRQGLFQPSNQERGAVRVLDDLGALRGLLVTPVLDAFPDVAPRCGVTPFDPANVEMRLISRGTASPAIACEGAADDRTLGFVLFVHREPRLFDGGALHLHSPDGESIVEPSQNSVVFFQRRIATRIGAVYVASDALIDSRLTLEGSIAALHNA